MSRNLFGSWGLGLDTGAFARALAAWGVLQARPDADLPPGDFVTTLRSQITFEDRLAPWRLTAADLANVTANYPAELLADSWGQLMDELSPSWPRFPLPGARLQVLRSPLIDPALPWLLRLLAHPESGVHAAFVEEPEAVPDGSWNWPLEIGFLDEPQAQELRRFPPVERWNMDLARHLTVPAEAESCDVLILPGPLSQASQQLLAAPRRLRAQLVFIQGGLDLPWNEAQHLVPLLLRRLRAAGLAITHIPPELRIPALGGLVEETSHNLSLDTVFNTVLENLFSPANRPDLLFFTTARFLRLSRLATTAQAMIESVEDMPEESSFEVSELSSDRLNVPAGSVPPFELAGALEGASDNFQFGGEGGEASGMAGLAHDLEMAAADGGPRPRKEPRYLQAQVFDAQPEGTPLETNVQVTAGEALLPDLDYGARVRIGPLDGTWLGPDPGAVFPEDKLPRTERFHRLQVVFSEPFHAPEPQVQTIELPSRGASTTADFFFHTRPERSAFEARIVVLYENRILQTALLRAPVLATAAAEPAGENPGLQLVIEGVVRRDLSGLERDPAFDAALVLNHNPAGEASLQAIAGESAPVIPLTGVKNLVDTIKTELGAIYRSPERFEDGLRGQHSQTLLWKLAVYGSQLYDSLVRNQNLASHPVLQAERLQVVTANVASFLPLEYIYDRTPPSVAAMVPLCDNAEQALQTGQCQCTLADESQAVCPLGFWGMRKVIERFAFDRPAEAQALDAEGFKLFAGIDGGRADLAPFGKVVYAASDRVDEDPEHPGQIQAVQDALTQVSGGPVQKIDDWGTWRQAVQAEQPSMLVLLPHNTINPLIQTVHGLEISTEQTRWYTDLRDQDVHDPQAASRPLVLLLGCETMSTDIPYESFVAKFLSLGAAIVLGTTTSVLGFHAAPVACRVSQILQEMTAESQDGGGAAFGEAMLRLRRQSMLEGYPMVLTLFAYGDAGWKLTASPGAGSDGQEETDV